MGPNGCNLNDKTCRDKDFLHMDGQKWFFEMESTPVLDAVKIVKMTKDLEYYINC